MLSSVAYPSMGSPLAGRGWTQTTVPEYNTPSRHSRLPRNFLPASSNNESHHDLSAVADFQSQSQANLAASSSPSRSTASESKEDDKTLVMGCPCFPKTLIPLHPDDSGQLSKPNRLGDNEFKIVPAYKHSLPRYVNNYASIPQLFCSEWTNHNCTQRGNAPMGEKGKLIIDKKWAETSNASNQCLVRCYTSSPKPPLSKIESKYLYERHRKSGLVR